MAAEYFRAFSKRKYCAALAALAITCFLALRWTESPTSLQRWQLQDPPTLVQEPYPELLTNLADYFTAYPLAESEFGQMGKRLQILKRLVEVSEDRNSSVSLKTTATESVEKIALSLVPFIKNPSRMGDHQKPLASLRRNMIRGSEGIVIATGKQRFRFACHLVSNLRRSLNSNLPIQIAYAGDSDLPAAHRRYIESLGPDITSFDVLALFDDASLDLPNGGWAIKPFAALGSSFERVMLLDADAVFLQKPETIFETHPGFLSTGTLLFHDRLLWQGAFKERHQWWEQELNHTHLSKTIQSSKVFVEGFAEEGDSGVVVADKGRLDVLLGLLHICWQNTKGVREQYTYRMGYGDKESWWFGFELMETPYAMETHYGAMLGHKDEKEPGKVCSFTIAHVDQDDRLLWYNGGLLKNKEIDSTEFDVPEHWMLDGEWHKGATKQDLSCMTDVDVKSLRPGEEQIIRDFVAIAQEVDADLRQRGLADIGGLRR